MTTYACTLATINVPWLNFGVSDKVPGESAAVFIDTRIPFKNIVADTPRVASMQKLAIRLTVLMEYRGL